MGDNIFLGDRDGVRTPMQWTGDRNGGFSRADFAQLFLPPLMDPVYGYQAVNVEAQLRQPNSLLRWLPRLIALRKQHPVFALGTCEVIHARVVDRATLREDDPALVLELVEVGFETGMHETYQLLADESLDALGDPRHVRELVHLIRGSRSLPAGDGVVEFGALEGFAGVGQELREARPITTEQSNTSIVFDEELILKVFRRLEAGINPELELLRFLTERGFANIAQLAGWYAYSGRPMDATLGILQRFVAGAVDGWTLALDSMGDEAETFLLRLHRLGEVTGHMHSLLGSDVSDPAFAPEAP